MSQFPPFFAPPPNHVRHGSSATQPGVERTGVREAVGRSRSATQPGLEPAAPTFAARSPFDDPLDPELEGQQPLPPFRRASAYTEPPPEPSWGRSRARSLSGSSRPSSSSRAAPSRYDPWRAHTPHLTRVSETHESFDEARMAAAAAAAAGASATLEPSAVPAALQPGGPYGPGPTPANPPPSADPVGARPGREDPRVQALLEALRIEAREGAAPPSETTQRPPAAPTRESSHLELRTILDAIRAQPQRWSLPRQPDAPQPVERTSRQPSVNERRAGPPLEIAAGKPEATVTATAVNSASTATQKGWAQVPPSGVSSASKGGEDISHVEQGRAGTGVEDNSWFVADADQPAGHTKEFDQPLDENLVSTEFSSPFPSFRLATIRRKTDISPFLFQVTWDGPDDPTNPANWPMGKKYATSMILSVFSFIAPFSATMVGPALDVIGTELAIPPGPSRQLIGGVQVLAAGLGPFLCAPLIEGYGRAPVIRYAHLWHLVWNTACGFATSGPQLIAFRFIGGIGASATQIVRLSSPFFPPPLFFQFSSHAPLETGDSDRRLTLSPSPSFFLISSCLPD